MIVRQIQVCLTDYNIIPHPCEVGVGQFYAFESQRYLYPVVLLMWQTLAIYSKLCYIIHRKQERVTVFEKYVP